MSDVDVEYESIYASLLREKRACGAVPSDRQKQCLIRAEISYYESLMDITDSTAQDVLYQIRIDELEELL